MGKVFRKAFRILGLDERKGRWVVEQDFDGNFYFTCFFAFLCGVLDRCMLILVWFEDLFTLYKLADKIDDVTSSTKHMDQHGHSLTAQGRMD